MTEITPDQEELPRFSSDGKGMLRKDEGICVLHLMGSDNEMARQHGELLATEIRQGVLPWMAGMFRLHIGRPSGRLDRMTSDLVGFLLDSLCASLSRNMPSSMMEPFHEMVRSAGLSSITADIAIGTPDLLLILYAMFDRLARNPPAAWLPSALQWKASTLFSDGMARRERSGLGCSGVVALPTVTADGHLLHARNMDYDGFGYLDRFPTVAFCRPSEGQPYAWIGSAGVHTAALTGMNSSGLFLGSNTAPTTDVSLAGMPFFGVNENVIRNARNLDEACAFLMAGKAASGYNVHISHGPSGQAAVVEYSYNRVRVRHPDNGFLAVTNHYVHPEMAETIPALSLLDRANTEGRYNRLLGRLLSRLGRIDILFLADCMRDLVEDRTRKIRPTGDIVCNYMNLTSVLSDVTERRFFVSADRSPAALGRYIGFDFDAEMAHFHGERSYPLTDIPRSSVWGSPAHDCVLAYQRAHVELVHRHAPSAAMAELEKAHEAFPKDTKVLLAMALLSMVLGRFSDSRRYATRYLERTDPQDPRRYRAHLLLAWCADLMSQPSEASGHLARAEAESRGDPASELETARWKKTRFDEKERSRMRVDLFNGRKQPI